MSPFLPAPQLLSCEPDFDGICQDARFALSSELYMNTEIDFLSLVLEMNMCISIIVCVCAHVLQGCRTLE